MSTKGSTKPDTYVLGRDFKSASRLNYQHYLWYETLQFNLHHVIIDHLRLPTSHHDAKSGPPRKIADVACGSGAWVRDVAQSRADLLLDGFDLSLAQCPPEKWLPSNVRLREWDLFQDPPGELLGCYDVVHTRLLFTVVQHEDPRPIIRNLIRLLKPGGYLQWDELDVEHSFMMRLEPGLKAPVMEEILGQLTQKGSWVRGLPAAMEECGLQEVTLWTFEERQDLAKAFFDNNLAKDEEMAENALKGTAEGAKLLEMVMEMYRESQEGVVICTPKVVCTAKKATN
ncbi:MAG: hypothetical protein Q9181_002090 [Wetmoreana brouardii]